MEFFTSEDGGRISINLNNKSSRQTMILMMKTVTIAIAMFIIAYFTNEEINKDKDGNTKM